MPGVACGVARGASDCRAIESSERRTYIIDAIKNKLTEGMTPEEANMLSAGDTIDFVTDCYESVDSDSFVWAPVIKLGGSESGSPAEWNAKQDFSGPKEIPQPLGAWEKFAQVLLMSNELVFVD